MPFYLARAQEDFQMPPIREGHFGRKRESFADSEVPRGVDSLSPIELLPADLAWKLFEYVPEALYKLTRVSFFDISAFSLIVLLVVSLFLEGVFEVFHPIADISFTTNPRHWVRLASSEHTYLWEVELVFLDKLWIKNRGNRNDRAKEHIIAVRIAPQTPQCVFQHQTENKPRITRSYRSECQFPHSQLIRLPNHRFTLSNSTWWKMIRISWIFSEIVWAEKLDVCRWLDARTSMSAALQRELSINYTLTNSLWPACP